jgi:hypothetical protein
MTSPARPQLLLRSESGIDCASSSLVPLNDSATSASFPFRLRGTVSFQHLDDVARRQQFEAQPAGRALFDDEQRRHMMIVTW